MLRRPVPQEWRSELGKLLRFAAVGVLNTVIGLGTIYLLQIGLEQDYRFASAAGYTLGIINSFVLNRAWTFRSRDGRVARQGLRFLVSAGICWLIQLGFLVLMVEVVRVHEDAAQPVGMVIYTGLNYLANRFFVFSGQGTEPR